MVAIVTASHLYSPRSHTAGFCTSLPYGMVALDPPSMRKVWILDTVLGFEDIGAPLQQNSSWKSVQRLCQGCFADHWPLVEACGPWLMGTAPPG